MKMSRVSMLFVVMALALASATQAAVQVCKIFSDHMVLQRGRPVPVFGNADAGEKVTVTFGEKSVSATADAQGNWKAMLPAIYVWPGDNATIPAPLMMSHKQLEGPDSVTMLLTGADSKESIVPGA